MKIFSEKRAESFLEERGFKVIERIFIKKEKELRKAAEKIGFPLVMKASGRRIIHKNRIGGVKKDIRDYESALKCFKELKRVKDSEGVMLQKQIEGKEFLLGIKKTPEFGHVIAFGAGGIYTEEFRDVSFRVCPFDNKEAKKMIKEVKVSKNIDEDDASVIKKNIICLCRLAEKYPKISELDINPLIVKKGKEAVVDARIAWN